MDEPLTPLALESQSSNSAVFIPVPEAPTKTNAELVAETLIPLVNDETPKRGATLKNAWETLWENHRASPQEIFDALQAKQVGAGQLVLLAGSLCVQDLENIAAALGKTFTEVVGDQKYYTTKHPIILNQDGSVTVGLPEV